MQYLLTVLSALMFIPLEASVADGRFQTVEICTGNGIPSGSVVVDKRSDFIKCPSPPNSNVVYTVLILESLSNHPNVGDRLEVCRDQSVPSHWSTESDGAVAAEKCPRDPGAAMTGSRTIYIVRNAIGH